MKWKMVIGGVLLAAVIFVILGIALHKPDLCSLDYAKFIQQNPGGNKDAPQNEKTFQISLAQENVKTACQLYRDGSFNLSVKEMEKALKHYATDRYYFYYGRSLYEDKQYLKSIKAFETAIALGYNPGWALYYKMACATCQLGDVKKAGEYLDVAFANGMADLRILSDSPELKLARAQPEWDSWLKSKEASLKSVEPKILVARYRFDGDATDQTSNHFDGLMAGPLPTNDRNGSFGKALHFNGFNNFITLPKAYDLYLSNHSFTVTIWAEIDMFREGDHTILGMDYGKPNTFLHLVIRNRRPFMGFYTNDTWGNTDLFEGRWYHIAYRYDRSLGQQAIFVDGRLDNAEGGHVPFGGDAEVHVGRWCNGLASHGSTYMNGSLDDLRIYNYALTDEEIEDIYYEKD